MTVRVERAECNEKTFHEIMDTCLVGLREVAFAPIDFNKTLEQAYITLAENMSFIVRDEQDVICGCVGMASTDMWYSQEPMVFNRVGPFIRKDQRFGTAGIKLMRAVKDLAEELDRIAFWWIPKTRRERKSAGMLYAEVAAYVPQGRIIMIREWQRKQQDTAMAMA